MTTAVPSPRRDQEDVTIARRQGWGWPYGWIGSPLRVAIFAFVFLTGAGNVALYDNLSDIQRMLFAIGLYVQAAAFLFHPKFKDISIAVVAVVLSIFVFFAVTRTDFTSGIAVAYASYLVSAHSPARWRKIWLTWLLLGVAVACAFMVVDFGMFERHDDGIRLADGVMVRDWAIMCGFFVLFYAVVGFFWLWGLIDRRRQEQQELVRQRAEMSATVERTRIAREMHDIVAHNLAGIMALADGARYAGKNDPAVALEALETISAQSRASLTQMRGLLSVLREDTSRELHAAPGREELATLVAEARRKDVNLSVSGLDSVPRDLGDLVQFTLYRVVQELVTNIMRHSAGRRGSLHFEVAEGAITVTATNPINGEAAKGAEGFGLIGMSERLRAHGGKLSVERTDDSFTAVAYLPTK